MAWILKRTNKPGYVARVGGRGAYVVNPKYAQRFPTREVAEAERCPGNEVPVYVPDTEA